MPIAGLLVQVDKYAVDKLDNKNLIRFQLHVETIQLAKISTLENEEKQ